jgi:hypothetical protein
MKILNRTTWPIVVRQYEHVDISDEWNSIYMFCLSMNAVIDRHPFYFQYPCCACVIIL